MAIRDLFEREVEKISMAIARLLGIIGDLKRLGKLEEAELAGRAALKDLFSIDIELIHSFSNEKLLAFLENLKGEQLRALGNLLFELADIERQTTDSTKTVTLANKVKLVFNLANTKSKTVHFETIEKLEKMESW